MWITAIACCEWMRRDNFNGRVGSPSRPRTPRRGVPTTTGGIEKFRPFYRWKSLLSDTGWRGISFANLPLQDWRAHVARRQMNKANQFVAVQNHSTATGLTEQCINDMFLERIVVVFERNEMVALRIGKRTQRSSHVACDLRRMIECPGLRRYANDSGEKGL